MSLLAVVFIALSLFSTNVSCRSIRISPSDLRTQIAGGTLTNINDVPWQAALRFRNTQYAKCGGTIIHKNWILTAAHCMFYSDGKLIEAADLDIVIGATNIKTSPEMMEVPLQRIVVHEHYHHGQYHYDLALLKTNVDLIQERSNFKTSTISLAEDEDIKPYAKGLVSGYGILEYKAAVPNFDLYSLNLTIVPDIRCYEAFSDTFDGDIMFCAGDLDSFYRKDTCSGDSGGPFVITNEGGERVLAGVTSFGRQCGNGVPSGYVRVPSFRRWIRKTIVNDQAGD